MDACHAAWRNVSRLPPQGIRSHRGERGRLSKEPGGDQIDASYGHGRPLRAFPAQVAQGPPQLTETVVGRKAGDADVREEARPIEWVAHYLGKMVQQARVQFAHGRPIEDLHEHHLRERVDAAEADVECGLPREDVACRPGHLSQAGRRYLLRAPGVLDEEAQPLNGDVPVGFGEALYARQ